MYGPNGPDPNFFNKLNEIVARFRDIPTIIGGDWNATLSMEPVQTNIDVLNMARLPNVNHSTKISEMSNEFSLSDPFRLLYPDRKEYTYVPRFNLSQNRSRLDFFLVSDTILDAISDCKIQDGLQNKLFDHKAVSLVFNKSRKKQVERYAITKKDLNDDLLGFLVHSTVAETYLHNIQEDRIYGNNKNFLLNTCGTIKNLIRESGPPFELRLGIEFDRHEIEERQRKIVRIQVLCQLLNLQALENGTLSCNPQVFMETLLLNIKNDTTSHQSFIRHQKNKKKHGFLRNYRI
jgi:hypothetical protein